ncbi:PAS domain S-box protein [Propionivibrio sp.]|uniref:PAS domain S-box protein n=1 Tax=Propionivibrio sp. TaxID=2212460 RepID=UPI003BF25AC9
MNHRQVNLTELRERAEAAIERSQSGLIDAPGSHGESGVRHLVEELRVYQTELEIQNQELVSAQSEISLALEKYRALFENLPLPGIIVDGQGFIVEANLQASEFLGLSQNVSLQRRSALQLFEMDSRSQIYQVLRDRANLAPQTIDLLGLKGSAGHTIHCDVHVIHLHEESQHEGRTLLVLVDQSTEMALRESEHNLRTLADSSMTLIWAATTDRSRYYINKGWLEFTGRTLEQELGNGWAEGVHPDDFERYNETYGRNFDERKAFSIDYRLRHQDGEYRWIRDNGTTRYDSTGQFIGYIGHCLDITDRVDAENQLRKLSRAVEQSPESIVITDKDSVIEYVNPACVISSGYSAEELLGQNPSIFNSGLTPRGVFDELWATLVQGKSWAGEFCNRQKNGEIFYEYVRITPIRDAGGEITSYVAVKEDVSEKRRISEELDHYRQHLEDLVQERTTALSIAKEAAEAANRAKSTFLANMSHELRTPMNAIMGMTNLALRRATDPRQTDQLTKVTLASQHLLGVINDILDLSKIEAERLSLEQISFKLGSVLENLGSLIGHKVTEKGLKLLIDVTPELANQPLQGDPLRLGQILLNLAGNAIKFTAQGFITIRVLLAEAHPAHVFLRFEVRDTGIGISSEDQKRLFTAFEQGDGSMTRHYGGTGLGLAISKRLVQMMDGSIGVESQPGTGSVFWFTARFDKGTHVEEQAHGLNVRSAEEHLKTHFSGTRILLVEDEPINQEVSRWLLEETGLTVDLAEDGVEALEMAEHIDYDLILMDIQMPRLNGIEATQAIRAIPGRQNTPILAMTANAFDEDRQRCIDAGMNDHIGKPVDPDKLFETLLKWLAKEN